MRIDADRPFQLLKRVRRRLYLADYSDAADHREWSQPGQAGPYEERVFGVLPDPAVISSMLIFKPDEIIAFVSSIVTLEPGDVIATGSPPGAGFASGEYLNVGDVVELEVQGIGVLRNRIGQPEPRGWKPEPRTSSSKTE